MEAAYKAGVNFFDCAEGYAEGKQQYNVRIVRLSS